MKVPFRNMQEELKPYRNALHDVVDRVIASGSTILGMELRQFEAEWARACRLPDSVGVGNGMDALEVALRAAQLPPRSEVLVPEVTAMATLLAVVRAGHVPVLVDIDPATGLLDLGDAEAKVSPRTSAMIVVLLYGRMFPVDQIQSRRELASLRVFEDAAQAHGAHDGDRFPGHGSAAVAWSFYPTKNLGALGDAGALGSETNDIIERARAIRNYGQTSLYQHDELGLNSRLDEIQAGLLRARLMRLTTDNARRRQVADFYRTELAESRMELLSSPSVATAHVHHLFVGRVPRRAEFLNHMRSFGVECMVHYPRPLSQQRAAAPYVPTRESASATAHCASCVSLPCNTTMTDAEVEAVVQAVKRY